MDLGEGGGYGGKNKKPEAIINHFASDSGGLGLGCSEWELEFDLPYIQSPKPQTPKPYGGCTKH